eukprot:6066105-Prymnesium_polylepis.1
MPSRPFLRSFFHSSSASSRPRMKPTVSSIPPSTTPAFVSSRLAPARASCARPSANMRSAPVLVMGQPFSRSRSSVVILSSAQMPPGRNSEAWLR